MSFHVRRIVTLLAVVGLALAGLSAVAPAQAAAPGHTTIVSDAPAANTPAVDNGEVDAIVQVGSTVVVGGTFSSVTPPGGSAQTRNYIFAFNATTGALISSFAPTLNGSVNELIAGPTANTVYVGGAFTQVNGAAASHITLLNVTTGAVSGGFKAASTNGVVNTMIYRDGRLFVGGNFTKVGNVAHGGLASLNGTTGALDPYVNNQVSGHHNDTGSGAQGAVGVRDMDLNAAGTRLVAIGNFKTVDGLARDQLVLLTLGSSSTTVTADWNTNRYQPYCFNWAFDTYMRGVSFSPDGSYFVVAATGGYVANTLCDAAARFETNATGTNIQPTWVDYTGGDTVWGVTVTETAVYVGGHQRWMNNSLASDTAGPGAVPRPGLAALNINTGVPLKWNPGRNPRGSAVYALYPTPQGLWMGSDTEYVGAHYKYKRPRIAFFPLAGGSPEASDAIASLPGTAYVAGRTGQNGNVLYRVNAAGPTLGAADAGPDWVGDDSASSPYHNAGSNIATYASGATTDNSVPSSTPNAVFDSERWSPSDNPAMEWDFTVPTGTPIQVRLYFANRCSCTSGVGQRVFDVSIDGTRVLDHYDIVKDVGDQRGTMKSFNLTSDGRVDIDFRHEVENPLINAIEIVRTDQAPPSNSDDSITAVPISSAGAGAAVQVPSSGISWGSMRGAFLAGGKLYYGLTNGTFNSRTYSNGNFGSQTAIDPYHDPDWDGVSTGSGNTYDGVPSNYYGEIANVTGAAYANGRLYYHVSGQSALYWRWFNTDSGIVGSDRFTVSSSVNFTNAMGMFVAGGTLYYVTKSDGNLNAVGLNGSATSGTPAVVDGPTSGGNDWRSRVLFLSGASAPANKPPTASFTVECVELNCTFDASGSSDPDGTIASYSWTFGDGSTATGQVATHAYSSGGSYSVKLTVKDDLGATGQTTKTASPTDPVPPSHKITFQDSSSKYSNTATPTITLPSNIQAGDLMVMTAALNSVTAATTPSGWKLVDQASTIGTTTYVWTRIATSGDAGAARTVPLAASTKSALSVVAYRGADAAQPIDGYATGTDSGSSSHTSPTLTTPTTDTILTIWTDKSPDTGAWTPPPSVQQRVAVYSTGTGRVSTLVADSAAPADGHAGGLTATTDVTSTRSISWTIAIKPA
jgi:PKD repeat protein